MGGLKFKEVLLSVYYICLPLVDTTTSEHLESALSSVCLLGVWTVDRLLKMSFFIVSNQALVCVASTKSLPQTIADRQKAYLVKNCPISLSTGLF
jgi:hypothetical protein